MKITDDKLENSDNMNNYMTLLSSFLISFNVFDLLLKLPCNLILNNRKSEKWILGKNLQFINRW